MPLTIRAATWSELPAAVACLQANSTVLASLQTGEYNPAGLFVAVNTHNQILDATLAVAHKGACGEILPPRVYIRELVQAGVTFLQNQKVSFIQMLHDTGDNRLAVCGFQHICRMLTLTRQVEARSFVATLAEEKVSRANEEVFSDVLLKSYTGSQDFPELNGIRQAEDILQSYAQSAAWPWLLIRHQGQPAGVLLLGPGNEPETAELQYMGIAPAYRGLGLGTALAARAVQLAGQNGAKSISLNADERNEQALKVYAGVGFRECGRCVVYLRTGLA